MQDLTYLNHLLHYFKIYYLSLNQNFILVSKMFVLILIEITNLKRLGLMDFTFILNNLYFLKHFLKFIKA